jgi:cysteine desulfurase
VDPERFLAAAAPGAAVAALILASHESGAVQPVARVAEGLATLGIPLVSDAALGPGRLPIRPDDLGVTLLALSGHKFGAPVGIGVLYVRRKTTVARVLAGGIQEERLRPGTENVAGARALAAALESSTTQREARAARYASLEARFLRAVEATEGWRRLGPPTGGLPGLATIEMQGVEGEAMMINLDLEGVAVATGSTCALGSADPSPGLLAMGLTPRRAASTIRVSIGEGVTESDVDRASEAFARVLDRLRALARPEENRGPTPARPSRPTGA